MAHTKLCFFFSFKKHICHYSWTLVLPLYMTDFGKKNVNVYFSYKHESGVTLVSSPTPATVPGKKNFPLISARGSSSSAEPATFDNHRRLKSFQNHRQREANLHSDHITARKKPLICVRRGPVMLLSLLLEIFLLAGSWSDSQKSSQLWSKLSNRTLNSLPWMDSWCEN